MRQIIYISTLVIALCISVVSCSDDKDTQPAGEALAIKASTDTIIISEDKLYDDAITFTWNKGLDRGDEYTIEYIFRLDIANNDFVTSTKPEIISADKMSKTFTNKDLNELLLEYWDVYPGEAMDLEARIVAKPVGGPVFLYSEIAKTTIYVKSTKYKAQDIFLTGTATSAGGDLNNAIEIKQVLEGKSYSWRGWLNTGSFKFITERGKELPSYNRGEDNKSLVFRKESSQADQLFDVEKPGKYGMILDRITLKISWNPMIYSSAYAVGDATPAGWSADNAPELSWGKGDVNVFTYEGPLKEGELKFLLDQRSWDAAARPLVPSGSIKDTIMQAYSGGEDLKWKVKKEEAGMYKVTLDFDKNTIFFVRQKDIPEKPKDK